MIALEPRKAGWPAAAAIGRAVLGLNLGRRYRANQNTCAMFLSS
jgi:hypothetical protein